jgi:tetratricopeptide (TPR) repeat protein
MTATNPTPAAKPAKKKAVRAIGPRLRVLLTFIFAIIALLTANSAYLSGLTFLGWVKRQSYENYFYECMFLAHLALGLLLIGPFIVFGIIHIRNTWGRKNKRVVRMGYAVFAAGLVVLGTGVLLMRLSDHLKIQNPTVRASLYWAHVIGPLVAAWLYILHRLIGPKIKWRVGIHYGIATAAVAGVLVLLNYQDPRKWNVAGPREGEKYFLPSLARTATGNFIPARTLMMDRYCMDCHKDVYNDWFHSAHHFSSFNNPAYLFSVRETRQVSLKRDGNVKAARWCAGCHDTVPFFSGAFDNPNFDDVKDPTAQAGLTCTTCHAITHVNSTRGNADYTIEEPIHYPFAFSRNSFLKYINRQLVKAKPEFHKETFLKPLHKSAEFCSTCHKVSIPGALNHYKEFLRGQNHYDTYLLSGVSGHGIRSFYYPDKAKQNCAVCHMPLHQSDDFGAKFFDPAQPRTLTVHNHLFPAANTGLAYLLHDDKTIQAEEDFLKGNLRVDIFGLKEGGAVDSPVAELRPQVPALKPGHTYLIDVVVRTLTVGHPFTQGTVDSNEVWLDVTGSLPQGSATSRIIARSGGMGAYNTVDPWSHFINVYMLDRDGNRIDRRNPQDIFTPLYNHQIPPGAGRVVHYRLTVPPEAREPLTFEVKVQYRKFDTTYMQYVYGKGYVNTLPVVTMASDKVIFPIEGGTASAGSAPSKVPEWQRWNDYGISLFSEGDTGSEKGELIQAADAFDHVEKLGRPDGPLNLARVYYKEGRMEDAVAALQRATGFNPPAPRWTVAWMNGLVDKQNGFLDKAISEFRAALYDHYPELEARGFDFSKDYEVINELGSALFERSKTAREDRALQKKLLLEARDEFEKTLALDSENVTAHYNLQLIYAELGDRRHSAEHSRLHERYRVDDNARDRAIELARRANPAADHAAEPVVIYDLQRQGAPGLQ